MPRLKWVGQPGQYVIGYNPGDIDDDSLSESDAAYLVRTNCYAVDEKPSRRRRGEEPHEPTPAPDAGTLSPVLPESVEPAPEAPAPTP